MRAITIMLLVAALSVFLMASKCTVGDTTKTLPQKAPAPVEDTTK